MRGRSIRASTYLPSSLAHIPRQIPRAPQRNADTRLARYPTDASVTLSTDPSDDRPPVFSSLFSSLRDVTTEGTPALEPIMVALTSRGIATFLAVFSPTRRRRLDDLGGAASPSDVTSDASATEWVDVPSPTSVQRDYAEPFDPTTPTTTEWPSQQRRSVRRHPARRAKPRLLCLTRVTVLSTTVGGASAKCDEAPVWHQQPPPLPPLIRVVSSDVDSGIDELEARGWWVAQPSPAAFVRAASDDSSGDAELSF